MTEFINRLIYVFKKGNVFKGNEKGGFTLKKNIGKIRLAVFLLAVMAMVLGASMTVYAGNKTCYVIRAGWLMAESKSTSRPKVYLELNTSVSSNLEFVEHGYVRVHCTVNKKNYDGWFLKNSLKVKSNTNKKGYRTTIAASILRKGDSDTSGKIMDIPKGKSVQVLGKSKNNKWYKVKYSNKTGYIPPEALDNIKTTRKVKGVHNQKTKLHSTPAFGDKNVLVLVPPNRYVRVIRYQGSFAYIVWENHHGYMAKSELS
jgi:uncharacterized protein YgiM (DUF1202 family)